MLFDVTAIAHDRQTGKRAVPQPRTERVDTRERNGLFAACANEADVKAVYEAFWNINPRSEHVVRVLAVKKVSG